MHPASRTRRESACYAGSTRPWSMSDDRRSSRSSFGESTDCSIATGLAALAVCPCPATPPTSAATADDGDERRGGGRAEDRPAAGVGEGRRARAAPAARGARRPERPRHPRPHARTTRQERQRPRWSSSSADSSSESSPSTRSDAHLQARSHSSGISSMQAGTRRAARWLVTDLVDLHDRVTRIGDRAEHDQHEPEHDEQRRERDRLPLLVGRRPAHPALQREDAPALALRARRAAVADEEAADQAAASRRCTSRPTARGRSPSRRSGRSGSRARRCRRRAAPKITAMRRAASRTASDRLCGGCDFGARAAHLFLGHRPALEREVALRDVARRRRRG